MEKTEDLPQCDSLVEYWTANLKGERFMVYLRCEGRMNHQTPNHKNRHGKKWTDDQEAGGIDSGN